MPIPTISAWITNVEFFEQQDREGKYHVMKVLTANHESIVERVSYGRKGSIRLQK